MPQRYLPPTRISMSQKIVVKPWGPHQRATCSGWVQALNTRARGASMMRETTSSRSAVALVLAATWLLLGLQLLQIGCQSIQALFPEDAIFLQPIGGAFEGGGFEAARTELRVAAAGDEAGVLQDFEMLGDGGQAHVERFGEFCDRGLSGREAREDGAPRGVGKGGESQAEVVGGHTSITGQLINYMDN